MKKLLFQIFCSVAVFTITWLGLQQINWMGLFRVNQITDNVEQELGDKLFEAFIQEQDLVSTPAIIRPIDSILIKVCQENELDYKTIKLHIVKSDAINAVALPGGHLVVFTGLIEEAEQQNELTGVICHELAHIRLNHVMKKLVSEIGLTAVLTSTSGTGGIAISEALKALSSSGFSRKLEKEADIQAIEYMINANVDPEGLATFLFRLSQTPDKMDSISSWLSTHPDSKLRAEYIIAYCKWKKKKNESIITQAQWNELKKSVKAIDQQ